MRNLLRALALLLVTITIVAPAAAPGALAEPRPLLAGPQLLWPPDGAHTTGNPDDRDGSRLRFEPLGIPTLEWQDMGASRYELEIATTAGFSASVVVRRSSLPYPTYTPTGFDEVARSAGLGLTEDPATGAFVDGTRFHWRVRAYDDANRRWGDWSVARRFVRHWGYSPRLISPAHLSTETFTPRFAWAPVPGASFYQIQVDTDPSFGSVDDYINDNTDLTSYTPTEALPNDGDLFWRVRAFHRPNTNSFIGGRGGVWSETRQFRLAWSTRIGGEDNRPLLLTPPNNANHTNRPLFCWQPVAGAYEYRIDVADHPGFVDNSFVVEGRVASGQTEGTCYSFPRDRTYELLPGTTYYWRVTAVNADRHTGESSAPFQFTTAPAEPPTVPELFYPPYYYPRIANGAFEERTVAVPTFIWGHVDGASRYELCIDDNVAMDCTSPEAIVIPTANTSYTFTDTATYPLQDGQTYYWKVRADVSPAWGALNTRWLTRIDRTRMLTGTLAPLLPTYQSASGTGGGRYGQESVRYYPAFAWRAVAPIGAATYEIEIALDDTFSAQSVVVRETTGFPEYTPTARAEPGTYYWRVRVTSPAAGAWSETMRFIVSRNFRFLTPTMDGDPADWQASTAPLYAPEGEDRDASGAGALGGVYIANDGLDWYLGLQVSPTITVALYLDVDHVDGSGATAPPGGQPNPGAPAAHLPEYAVFWSSTNQLGEVWRWSGTVWIRRGTLSFEGGQAAYGAGREFLELRLPVTPFGQPGSMSFLLLTQRADGSIVDRLPNAPRDPTASRFLTESTTPTPLLPVNAPAWFGVAHTPSDHWSLLQVERSTPVLRWRHNDALAPRIITATMFFETFMDDAFSTLYESERAHAPERTSSARYFFDTNTHWAPQVHYSDNPSYNWRIRRSGFASSTAHRFVKEGYAPRDLAIDLEPSGSPLHVNATPGFSWSHVQSAPEYRWEIYEGGALRDDAVTMAPYYTPREALPDGAYTWKVWARDAQGSLGAVAAEDGFVKISDAVVGRWDGGTRYYDAEAFRAGILRFAWAPVPSAAYYEVTIASDPNISRDINTYRTHNTVFSPDTKPKAAGGATVYVRVRMADNQDKVGPEISFAITQPRVYLPLVRR